MHWDICLCAPTYTRSMCERHRDLGADGACATAIMAVALACHPAYMHPTHETQWVQSLQFCPMNVASGQSVACIIDYQFLADAGKTPLQALSRAMQSSGLRKMHKQSIITYRVFRIHFHL